MSIGRIKLTKFSLTCRFLYVSLFSWLSISLVSYVFAQTDNVNADSEKSVSRGNKATNSKKPLVIKPEMVSEFIDHTKAVNQALASSDQENVGREVMTMIKEITKSNSDQDNIGREAMAMTTKITKSNSVSDQENIGREAMAMITEITKSNILYEKNKSSANLAFKEQKFKDREKHIKEMKEYNEKYNKKYLKSLERLQKMRGQHAEYSGVHSDYSAYLQQFLNSTSR